MWDNNSEIIRNIIALSSQFKNELKPIINKSANITFDKMAIQTSYITDLLLNNLPVSGKYILTNLYKRYLYDDKQNSLNYERIYLDSNNNEEGKPLIIPYMKYVLNDNLFTYSTVVINPILQTFNLSIQIDNDNNIITILPDSLIEIINDEGKQTFNNDSIIINPSTITTFDPNKIIIFLDIQNNIINIDNIRIMYRNLFESYLITFENNYIPGASIINNLLYINILNGILNYGEYNLEIAFNDVNIDITSDKSTMTQGEGTIQIFPFPKNNYNYTVAIKHKTIEGVVKTFYDIVLEITVLNSGTLDEISYNIICNDVDEQEFITKNILNSSMTITYGNYINNDIIASIEKNSSKTMLKIVSFNTFYTLNIVNKSSDKFMIPAITKSTVYTFTESYDDAINSENRILYKSEK